MPAEQVSHLTELGRRIRSRQFGLLAIDGPPGSGKTYAAQYLANELQIPCIHVDDFLIEHEGGYVDYIRYDDLEESLADAPAIIEGVCLLEILQRVDASADLFIYVSPATLATDTCDASDLSVEVSQYYSHHRPADMADIVLSSSDLFQLGSSDAMNIRSETVDIAFIQAKTRLAIALAAGGMLSLIVGLIVLLYGVTNKDSATLSIAGAEISATGIGGVIMITSVLWAFFSYKTRPKYASTHQVSEKFDSDDNLLERVEQKHTTEFKVQRKSQN
jgi:hypothetical protein